MGPYYGYGTQSQARVQNAPSEHYHPNQYPHNMPFQMSMQFPQYPSMAYSQVDNVYGTQSAQLETALKI